MSAEATRCDVNLKERRQELLSEAAPTSLWVRLSALVDEWFAVAGASLPHGYALAATAGYARGELCPSSDVDVMLLHDPRVNSVEEVARELWYPLWDAGIKVSPATHTLDSALQLASTDLVAATTLLSVRHLVGEPERTAQLSERARRQWAGKARKWLDELATAGDQRHDKAGEVAHLLEPELKDGRGGLRDAQSVQWAVASEHDAVRNALERPVDESYRSLLAVRAELHRRTGRVGDRLLLQEQDGVAQGLGFESADALMAAVSVAGRQIAWECDRFWHTVRARLAKRPSRWRLKGRVRVAADLVLSDGEVRVDSPGSTAGAGGADPSAVLHLSAAAAICGATPERASLHHLAETVRPWPEAVIWTDEDRNALVTLLGAGGAALPILEALDQERLFERVLPEWTAVRCKPQRNAFHRYNVDRHLWQTAVNAAALVRRVARPDLLLVGALLHDIGKGYPGDHTEVGIGLVAQIGARMGFPPEDVDVLVSMVEHHLLLPEVATRRDISDPGTIASVAAAVVDADRLALLHALVEADSLATGPTAWTDWKKGLVAELVSRTATVLAGHRPPTVTGFPAERHLTVMDSVRSTDAVQIVGDAHRCTVAARDRTGLFRTVAGVLSMHSVDVLSAEVWTADDGIALEEYRVSRRLGGDTNWRRVAADLEKALAGEIDIDAKLAEKAKAYASPAASRKSSITAGPTAAKAEVLIDNVTSESSTIVEVRAPDGIGVLYRVTSVLAALGLDIRHAKVATLGHEVVDAFYVVKAGDGKVTEAVEIDRLREALAEALSR